MEQIIPFIWIGIGAVGFVVASAMIFYAVRRTEKKEQKDFAEIDGTLKQDWTRTGKIDFHVITIESASPQRLTLRVQERKIVENSMGDDVVQLRWRLATLEEAKEVVVSWNRHGPQSEESSVVLPIRGLSSRREPPAGTHPSAPNTTAATAES
jgi:hypothetical protein